MMNIHQFLLLLHSAGRWLVLLFLLYAICRSARGYFAKLGFTAHDNLIRHLTATVSHVQLLLGLSLYMFSPVVKFQVPDLGGSAVLNEGVFFRYVHISLMVLSVVLVTIGSARAKRMETDRDKFRVMLGWFSFALLVIMIAIPWPFSPLATRPFFRAV
jgi:hypothetical protein